MAPSALAELVYLKVIPCSCGATMLFIQEAGTLDSFTVSLHSPNGRQLPAVRAVQGDCQQILKNVWNPHQSYTPIIHCMYKVPQLIFNQAITHPAKQPCHISHSATGSPTATQQGLWISLEAHRSSAGRTTLMPPRDTACLALGCLLHNNGS